MAEEHHEPLALPSSFWTANPTCWDSIRGNTPGTFHCSLNAASASMQHPQEEPAALPCLAQTLSSLLGSQHVSIAEARRRGKEGCKQGEGLASVCRTALPSNTHHSKLEEKGEKERTLKCWSQGFLCFCKPKDTSSGQLKLREISFLLEIPIPLCCFRLGCSYLEHCMQ